MLTNEELLGKFKLSLDSDFERFAEKTIEQNVKYVRRFLDASGKSAFEITQTDIKQYINELRCLNGDKMNPDTKDSHLSKIKNFFNFLYYTDDVQVKPYRFEIIDGERYPKTNPVLGIRPFCSSKAAKLERNAPKVGISDEDAKAFMNAIQEFINTAKRSTQVESATRDYAMFSLIFENGLRISDVIALDKENFDFDDMSLNFVIKKTKTPMKLPISEHLAKTMSDYWRTRLDKNEAAFTSTNQSRVGDRVINKNIKKYAELAGIDKDKISCHILRHTCGSMLYEQSGDLNFVKDMMGHKSISSTQRYITNNDYSKLNEKKQEISLAIW